MPGIISFILKINNRAFIAAAVVKLQGPIRGLALPEVCTQSNGLRPALLLVLEPLYPRSRRSGDTLIQTRSMRFGGTLRYRRSTQEGYPSTAVIYSQDKAY